MLKTHNSSAKLLIWSTLIFSLVYVVVRYHLFGGVPWKDFPFYILNKAIGLSSLMLLIYNFSFGPLKNLGIKIPENWLASRNILGMSGFVLALIHVFISFMLFTPAVYEQFFQTDGTLTLFAGLSMLGGVLSFVVLWIYNFSFQTNLREDKEFIAFITSRTFLLWAMLFSAVHLFFMGYEGWLNPAGWHGGIPPVSLVAFVFFVAGYGVNFLGRK